MSTALNRSMCCATCGSNGQNSAFTNHLHNCLKNLENEYDSVCQHRDQLLIENDRLQKDNLSKESVNDTMHRLTTELQQLRLENTNFREREKFYRDEEAKLRVSRVEYDKLAEEHKKVLDILAQAELKERMFSDVSLRAAEASHELKELQRTYALIESDNAKLVIDNTNLLEENESLRTAHHDLSSRVVTLEAELGPSKVALDNYNNLSQQFDELKDKYNSLQHSHAEISTRADNQDSLVKYLTSEVCNRGAVQVELDKLTRNVDRLTAENSLLSNEKSTNEVTIIARNDEISKLKDDIVNSKQRQYEVDLEHKREKSELEFKNMDLTHKFNELSKQHDLLLENMNGKANYDTLVYENSTLKNEISLHKKHISDLSEEVKSFQEKLNLSLGKTGKTPAELERLVASLKKELCVEQMANKKLCGELNDCRADRDAAMAVYKKLQGRYALVKEECEKLRAQHNGVLDNNVEVSRLIQEIERLKNEINSDDRRLLSENEALRSDLKQVMTAFDKLKLLADHYKEQLNQLSEANSVHACVKGKRCPCKSQSQPRSRWN